MDDATIKLRKGTMFGASLSGKKMRKNHEKIVSENHDHTLIYMKYCQTFLVVLLDRVLTTSLI